MLDNLAVVQLESWVAGSDDLDRLCALARRRLGGASLLEWVARRVTDAQLLDGTLVVLPGRREGPCGELAALVPPDVPVCFAEGATPLARLITALSVHPSRAVVLVGLGSPSIDPDHIDRLIVSSRGGLASDFIGFQVGDCSPSAFPRWCRVAALEQLAALESAGRPGVQASAAASLVAQFRQRWLPLEPRCQHGPHDLDLSHEEGWENTQALFDVPGHEGFDRPQFVVASSGLAEVEVAPARPSRRQQNGLLGA